MNREVDISQRESSVRGLVLVGLFAALTAISAYISFPVPFSPVPFTLQVLIVLLAGALLGPIFGAASQLVYVLIGAVGAPVFSGGGAGLAHLFGKTGGYLFGFIVAAFVVGWVLGDRAVPGLGRSAVAMALGLLAIYVPGVAWLSVIADLSLPAALTGGFLIFLPLDIVKAVIAILVVTAVKPRVGTAFNR